MSCSAPHRIPKVVGFLRQIICMGDEGLQHPSDLTEPMVSLLKESALLTWRANTVCTILEPHIGDSELESHLRFIASLSGETQRFMSANNLPFCNAHAPSFTVYHKLWSRISSDLEGRRLVCRHLHNPTSELGTEILSDTTLLHVSLMEFLGTRGYVLTFQTTNIPMTDPTISCLTGESWLLLFLKMNCMEGAKSLWNLIPSPPAEEAPSILLILPGTCASLLQDYNSHPYTK